MGAIPQKLLVHSCVLKKQTGLDRNRNPAYTQTVLKNVRIGATFQTVRGTVGETRADTLTLYIDAKNTVYADESGEAIEAVFPEKNDCIEWQGKTYTVRGITPCFARGENPHHWEVSLE